MNVHRGSRSIAIALCILYLLFFNWPFLSIAEDYGGVGLLAYLFIGWICAIGGIWTYCRKERRHQHPEENGEARP